AHDRLRRAGVERRAALRRTRGDERDARTRRLAVTVRRARRDCRAAAAGTGRRGVGHQRTERMMRTNAEAGGPTSDRRAYRLASLDILRGLVIVVMALDHV